MKFKAIVLFSLLFLAEETLMAAEPYVGIGYSLHESVFLRVEKELGHGNKSKSAHAFVGYRFDIPLSIEAGVGHVQNKLLKHATLDVLGYIPFTDLFEAYGGIGVGAKKINIEDFDSN